MIKRTQTLPKESIKENPFKNSEKDSLEDVEENLNKFLGFMDLKINKYLNTLTLNKESKRYDLSLYS